MSDVRILSEVVTELELAKAQNRIYEIAMGEMSKEICELNTKLSECLERLVKHNSGTS